MAQEKKQDRSQQRVEEKKKIVDKKKDRRINKTEELTKVVVRRLPPTWTEETVKEQLSPIPEHDYFHFAKADYSLEQNAFSRVYINFVQEEDIIIFTEKFDGYVFLDSKGNEFSAVVEFAPFPRRPKRKTRKPDSRCGTIEQGGSTRERITANDNLMVQMLIFSKEQGELEFDPELRWTLGSYADYEKFVQTLLNPDDEPLPAPEIILEEIEARERENKANKGLPKEPTPLLAYIKRRKEEKKTFILKAREERKKREIERRKQREDEKRRRREKDRVRQRDLERQRQQEKRDERKRDSQTPTKVVLLKNPDREKERKDSGSQEKESSRSSTNDSRTKEVKGDTRVKDDQDVDSPGKSKDYGAKGKFSDGDRLRERDHKSRGKPTQRESKWKEREDRDRDRDQDRQRDRGKFSGSRRDTDQDRSKARYGKHDDYRGRGSEAITNDKSSDSKYTDKYSTSTGVKDRTQSYQKRREEYRDRKTNKFSSTQKEKTEKPRTDSQDSKNEVPHVQPSTDDSKKDSVVEKITENEPSGSKVEDSGNRSDHSGSIEESGSYTNLEEMGYSGDKDDSGRDSKGRKTRYRDRPERAIYNPAHRAAQRRKELEARGRSKDSPETSQSPEAGGEND